MSIICASLIEVVHDKTRHWQERGKMANRVRRKCGKRGKHRVSAAIQTAAGGKGAASARRESAPGTRVGYNQGGDLMFVPVPLVANSVVGPC